MTILSFRDFPRQPSTAEIRFRAAHGSYDPYPDDPNPPGTRKGEPMIRTLGVVVSFVAGVFMFAALLLATTVLVLTAAAMMRAL